jgi:hypothetical protein
VGCRGHLSPVLMVRRQRMSPPGALLQTLVLSAWQRGGVFSGVVFVYHHRKNSMLLLCVLHGGDNVFCFSIFFAGVDFSQWPGGRGTVTKPLWLIRGKASRSVKM